MHPDIIKLQYQKLTVLLHPSANNSIAADGPYNLINGAWDVLSEPKKRTTYNYHMGYYQSPGDPFSGWKMDPDFSTSSSSAARCSSMQAQDSSIGKGKLVLVNT